MNGWTRDIWGWCLYRGCGWGALVQIFSSRGGKSEEDAVDAPPVLSQCHYHRPALSVKCLAARRVEDLLDDRESIFFSGFLFFFFLLQMDRKAVEVRQRSISLKRSNFR